MRGSGVVVDHQPLNTGGLASDTELIDMFGNPNWQRVADDFQLSESTLINELRWWGFYDQDNPPATEQFRVRVYGSQQAANLPDELNIIYEEYMFNPNRVATGRQIAVGIGPHEYLFSIELESLVAINAGDTHWLEIIQVGDLSTAFWWEVSTSENNGHAFNNAITNGWRHTTGGFIVDSAFQLVAVPEPASLVLVLLPTCLLVTLKRRRV